MSLVIAASVCFIFWFAAEKSLPTMFAAKVSRLPVTRRAAGGRFIHGHATNWVDCHDDSPFLLLPRLAVVHQNILLSAIRFQRDVDLIVYWALWVNGEPQAYVIQGTDACGLRLNAMPFKK